MIVELGHFALILALMVALVQTVLPLWGARRGDPLLMAVAPPAAVAQFALIALSFAMLTRAYVVDDFSLSVVVGNSHSLKPMLYKVTGVWGNHEGSLLLWVLILSLFGAMAAVFGGGLPERLRARVLAVQGAIGAGFLGFIVFTSNPFWRLATPPLDGQGMNPLLEDPGLAFHPPFLYLGYVGLSMSFSFAIAALIEGRVDAAWARWVRPWALAAWVFLTLGIAMGSWWAYYELGWGGFWFWDPVENASFMPWLLAAALVHSAVVAEKREALKSWTILLSILGFGFSLLGTFLVRSGVITSVHSFAADPARGVFILGLLAFFVGGGLVLFALRAGAMEAKGLFAPVSREGALVANNILLAVSAFVVFTGTLWPLIAEIAIGRTVSVGEPFFEAAFTPFFVVLAVILPVGAMLAWKRGNLPRVLRRLVPVGLVAGAAAALAFALQEGRGALGPVGLMLGLWLVLGALADLWERAGRNGHRLRRLRATPRADWGKLLAHAGLGVVFIAISAIHAWKIETVAVADIGQSFRLGPYDVRLADVREVPGPNYLSTTAEMVVSRDGRMIATLHPEKRDYPVQGMPTTEAAIAYRPFADIYLVIGDAQQKGGWAVRGYVQPMASWLWLGAAMMALGGILSLSDRRYRIAAGARRADPAGVPAG